MNLILRISFVYLISILLYIPWYVVFPEDLKQLILLTMILKIFFTGLVLSYIWVLFQKYRLYPSRAIIYLFLGGFLYFVAYYLEYVTFYFVNTNRGDLAELIYVIGQITSIISPVTVVLFLSQYRNNNVNPIHLVPTTIATGMLFQEALDRNSIQFNSFTQEGQTLIFLNYNQNSPWYYVGFAFSFMYILFYVIYTILQLNKETYEPVIKKQQRIFLAGIIFAIGVTPFLFYLVNQFNDPFVTFILNYSVANSFTILAIIVAIVPYLRNENPGYIQPQPLEQLIVIQKNGILLLSLSFSNEEIDDVLFSGAVSAVSSIMKEATGTITEIRKLEFEDKSLLTRFVGDLGFVLISGYETSALSDYIDNFSSSFSEKFHDEIQEAIRESKLLDQRNILNYSKQSFGLPSELSI